MSLQEYRRVHTIEINSLYLESENYDLKPYFLSMSIWEDLFTHFMTGQITIVDPVTFSERLPLTGWQKLVVNFRTNKDGEFDYFSKTFYIYKMSLNENERGSGTRKRAYTLHFISKAAKKDLSVKISRSYKNKKESEIVKNVVSSVFGEDFEEFEDSKYVRNLVVPNWKPTFLIDYMCQDAVRAGSYEATNYVFFESLEGFNFVSLDKLIEAGPIEPPITHEIAAKYEDHVSSTRQSHYYSAKENFNYIDNSANGGFGTRFIGVDFFHKHWENVDYVYTNEFGGQVKIDGDNIKLTENTIDEPEQMVKVGPMMKSPKGYNCDYSHKCKHKRNGMMQLWNNNSYEVDLDGDTRLKVGKKIEFQLPSYNANEEEIYRYDKYLSGNYLITSIHHHFSAEQHKQTLILRKPMLKPGG